MVALKALINFRHFSSLVTLGTYQSPLSTGRVRHDVHYVTVFTNKSTQDLTGSTTVKVVPLPGVLLTEISPPWLLTIP